MNRILFLVSLLLLAALAGCSIELFSESTTSTSSPTSPTSPTTQIPSAPSGLTGSLTDAGVSLTWNIESSAVLYKVYRSTSAGGTYSFLQNTSVPLFYDIYVIKGATYSYKVTAWNSRGESPFSSSCTVRAENGMSASLTARLCVWSSDATARTISVNIDGSYYGSLTTHFTAKPALGAAGTLTLTLPVGPHLLHAKCSVTGKTWGPTSFMLPVNNLFYQLYDRTPVN